MLQDKYKYNMTHKNVTKLNSPNNTAMKDMVDKVMTATKVQVAKKTIVGGKKASTRNLDLFSDKCVPFPARPALRFIPSTELSHQLIYLAILDNMPDYMPYGKKEV